MSSQIVRINSRKFDDSIHRSWNCRLVRRDGPLLLFDGEFSTNIEHQHIGLIKRGTLSYEYYWLDRWYSIFRFHEPDGTVRNFYCNINMPPVLNEGVLDYVDLDIDVLVWPELRYAVLDEAEYELNSERYKYPETVRRNVASALRELISMIENNLLPAAE